MELAALHIVDRQMPRLCQILCRGGGNCSVRLRSCTPTFATNTTAQRSRSATQAMITLSVA